MACFKDDFSLDIDTFERTVDFHIRHGAVGIAIPFHKAESLNLTMDERKALAEASIRAVDRRVPVLVHASMPGTDATIELALHAQNAGASFVSTVTPYHWRPSQDALYAHYVAVGSALDISFLAYNAPAQLGVRIEPELLVRLIEQLPNFIGIKEASFNSREFCELRRAASPLRPDFAFIAGVEWLAPSVVMGGWGSYSSTGGVAPQLPVDLFAACVAEEWDRARALQYSASRLWAIFREQYPSSLKAAMAMMGRPVGPTRLPLPTADPDRERFIRGELEKLGIFDSEPHGWS